MIDGWIIRIYLVYYPESFAYDIYIYIYEGNQKKSFVFDVEMYNFTKTNDPLKISIQILDLSLQEWFKVAQK
jgi:hypothetical protein